MDFHSLISPSFTMTTLRTSGAETIEYPAFLQKIARTSTFIKTLSADAARVALVFDAGSDFFASFLGCLACRAVPFAVRPLRGDAGRGELDALIRDADPSLILTDAQNFQKTSQAYGRTYQVVCIDQLPFEAAPPTTPSFDPDDVAYIQYSSGSTSSPKGIMITYGNFLTNIDMISQCFEASKDDVYVSWLPHFHDMGLVGAHLMSARLGMHLVQLPPGRLLVNPLAWLRAISDYNGTISGAPNFAYDLCVRRAAKQADTQIDLSSWRVAYNGSDTVRTDTLRDFDATFGPKGLRPSAMKPVYGLAESTVFICGASGGKPWQTATVDDLALQSGRADDATPGKTGVELVNCGQLWGHEEVAIVDPDRRTKLPERQVGEIWVRGPHTAKSYLWDDAGGQETLNASILPAHAGSGGWLRSGDLGCQIDGDLFITGRMKDVVILNGRTLAAPEIEACAGPVSDMGVPNCVAFESRAQDGDNSITLVVEAPSKAQHNEIAQRIWAHANANLVQRFDCRLGALVIVRGGEIPRTTSGKLRRDECRRRLEAGQLNVLWTKHAIAHSRTPAPKGAATEDYLIWLRDLARDVTDTPRIPTDVALPKLGIDSLSLMRFVLAVEDILGTHRMDLRGIEAKSLADIAQDLASPYALAKENTLLRHAPAKPRKAPPARRLRSMLSQSVPLPAYAPLLRLRLQSGIPLRGLKAQLAQNTRHLCTEALGQDLVSEQVHRNLHAIALAHRLQRRCLHPGQADRYLEVNGAPSDPAPRQRRRGCVYVCLHTHVSHLLPLAARFRDAPLAVVGNYQVGVDGPSRFHLQRLADARQVLVDGGHAFVLIDGSDGTGGVNYECFGRKRTMRPGFAEIALAGDGLIVPVLPRVTVKSRVVFDCGAAVDLRGKRSAVDDACALMGAWVRATWPKQLGLLNVYGQEMQLKAPRLKQ